MPLTMLALLTEDEGRKTKGDDHSSSVGKALLYFGRGVLAVAITQHGTRLFTRCMARGVLAGCRGTSPKAHQSLYAVAHQLRAVQLMPISGSYPQEPRGAAGSAELGTAISNRCTKTHLHRGEYAHERDRA
jgi:hypothetical protein